MNETAMKRAGVILLAALFAASALGVFAGGEKEPAAAPDAVETGGGKYTESPMLTARVEAGELPPVEQRLPPEPAVVQPFDEAGRHGGTLQVFLTSNLPWDDFMEANENGPKALDVDLNGNIVGDIMTSYEMPDDYMSVTLFLREGIKWSDGTPLSMDDFLFMWNDMHGNPDVQTWGGFIGPVDRAEKVDDTTLKLIFREPTPRAPLALAQSCGMWALVHPKHYLQKWHIDHNPDAEKVAKEEGYDNWWEALYQHFWWAPLTDIEKPTLQPWIMTRSDSTAKMFERNPYYHKVDPEGNQLPYIDKIYGQIVTPEVSNLKVISGESDIAYMRATFDNYTLYKENEDAGDYTVHLIEGFFGSDVAYRINLTDDDPVKRELFNNRDFRIALSVAIDRDEINKVVYHGKGVPRQATVLPRFPWYKEEWAEAYAEYDPDEANRLLDEIGLDKKNGEGFRLRPGENKALQVVIVYPTQVESAGVVETVELTKEFWEAVGIKTMIKGLDQSLFWESASQYDAIYGFIEAGQNFNVGDWAGKWKLWLNARDQIADGTATLEDFDRKMPGEEPPEYAKELRDWWNERALHPVDSKEYADLSRKILDFQAANIPVIGTVGMVPSLIVAKNNIGNVPTVMPYDMYFKAAIVKFADQVYIKK